MDISGVSTDDQNLNLAANTLSIEDGNSVDLSPYLDNTDDQNLTGASLNGSNILQIDIENGTSTTVDLSSLDDSGTDDQNLNLAANTLSIEDGNSVDLSPYLDNTDDQTISTDGTAGNLSIEDGNTIALNVDDADADPTNEYNTGISFDGTNLTVTDAGGNQSVDISGVSTDDQNLNLAANTLSIEDGNSVDLSPYLDNTDDQNISGSGLSGTDLTIGIENGASEVVDLSSLVGTDDQNLNLAANTLSIEDGNSVDLSPYLDNTDDQNLTGASLNGSNILQIDIENGQRTSTTVDG